MSRIMRAAVLACALLSSLAVMSTSASAVTWHNSGDTAYTATGGPVTVSSTSVNMACTSTSQTATMGTSPFVGATWAPERTATSSGAGCLVAGIATTWHCHVTYTATGKFPGGDTGIGHATCSWYQFNTKVCHAGGAFLYHYINPSGAFGRVTITHHVLTPAAGCASVLGGADPKTVGHQTVQITNATGGPAPHTGPIVDRTA